MPRPCSTRPPIPGRRGSRLRGVDSGSAITVLGVWATVAEAGALDDWLWPAVGRGAAVAVVVGGPAVTLVKPSSLGAPQPANQRLMIMATAIDWTR